MEVALILGNCRGWKNFEKHNRKNLYCLEQTVSRNMDFNDSANENSERSEEHGRKNINCLREYLNHHEQTFHRNIRITSATGEAQMKMRNMLLKTGEKGILVI